MSEALASTDSLAPPAPRHLAVVESPVSDEVVPVWRGVSHGKASAFAPAFGFLLVRSAEGALATVAAALFAATMISMLGVSSINHRLVAGARWRASLRRLDHAAIYTFLAGTSTSVALIVLSGTTRVLLIAVLWAMALTASLVTVIWVRVPGWIPAIIALGVGWSTAAPLLAAGAVSSPGLVLFAAGGVLYSAGATVYVLGRPSPRPSTFGSHEVFHALVLAGVACHYLAIGFFVLPLAGKGA